MTPLAHAIARGFPMKRNGAGPDISREILNAHFFDLSAVDQMVKPLAVKMLADDNDIMAGTIHETDLVFLPAPATWIEVRADGTRRGTLLLEAGDLAWCAHVVANEARAETVCEWAMPLRGHEDFGAIRVPTRLVEWADDEEMTWVVYDSIAQLAIINSPRIIGRRTHRPHAGLQRELARRHKMPGLYPLHAWQEIVLTITPPAEHEGKSVPTALTGGKALHFCRAHLRIQGGQLVYVSAHWRGNPALGIRRSRYRIKASV